MGLFMLQPRGLVTGLQEVLIAVQDRHTPSLFPGRAIARVVVDQHVARLVPEERLVAPPHDRQDPCCTGHVLTHPAALLCRNAGVVDLGRTVRITEFSGSMRAKNSEAPGREAGRGRTKGVR